MKKIENLLKIVGMKFKFQNSEIRFQKGQDSFLVVKIVQFKCGITNFFSILYQY